MHAQPRRLAIRPPQGCNQIQASIPISTDSSIDPSLLSGTIRPQVCGKAGPVHTPGLGCWCPSPRVVIHGRWGGRWLVGQPKCCFGWTAAGQGPTCVFFWLGLGRSRPNRGQFSAGRGPTRKKILVEPRPAAAQPTSTDSDSGWAAAGRGRPRSTAAQPAHCFRLGRSWPWPNL